MVSTMQQVLGCGGFSSVALVQLPGGRVGGKEVLSSDARNPQRMNLELHLLEGARKDHVANVLWALSSQIDNQRGVISFDMEPADRLILGEYIQNNTLNYISPELVQWMGLQVVRGLGCLHSKRSCTRT